MKRFVEMNGLVLAGMLGWNVVLAEANSNLTFNRDIRPILSENCFACHGRDAKHRKAELRLDVQKHAFGKSKSGKTAIERSEKKPVYAALKIQSGKVRSAAGKGNLATAWEIDPNSLPQFSFTITAHDNAAGRGEPLVKMQKVEPHTRTTELALPKNLDPNKLHWHLRIRDILGNESAALPLEMSK